MIIGETKMSKKTDVYLMNKTVETNRIYLRDLSFDEIIRELDEIKSRYDDTHSFTYTASIESDWGSDYIEENYTVYRLETIEEAQERKQEYELKKQQQALDQISFYEEQINRLKGTIK